MPSRLSSHIMEAFMDFDSIIWLILGLLLLIAFEFLWFFRKRGKLTKRDQDFIKKEYQEIQKMAERDVKHAILMSDKLFDYVLLKRGFPGSLGDKLKRAESFFSSPNNVWAAHKLRNRIVHEVGFEPLAQEVSKALSSYKQALWELGVRF